MVTRLVLILGDQLAKNIAALKSADKAQDIIVMAEVMAEGEYVPHHPQKIALVLSAMRKFAASLEADGWRVAYSTLDDPQNGQSIGAELLRRAEEFGATEVITTRPGEWRLIEVLEDLPLPVTLLEDDRFIASHADFDAWAEGRKELRMEFFYREMRRKTGLLMEGEKPAGGKWNFDAENRKPAKADLFREKRLRFEPDATTAGVLDLVESRFGDHFGTLRPFGWATDREGATRAFRHFVDHALLTFGDEQDAMLAGDPLLSHALISPYLNIGLLDPKEVCQAVEEAWKAGKVPLNAAEGFIRQIIGWREFVRGVYFREGPGYAARNDLGHDRALPALYWGGETRMNCLGHAVGQTRDLAYAHHIQRLMVTGNFALLAGVDPGQVHEWYLAVYVDAFEWVEAPNTVGMSQFADGGVVGSKPYVSSGAYLDRMSDYCGDCHYRVTEKTGEKACPFNLLYWDFLARHRDRFESNPRMRVIYGNWDRMEEKHRRTVRREARGFLERLDRGEIV